MADLAAVGGKPQLYTRLLATFGWQLDDLDRELIVAVVGADWGAPTSPRARVTTSEPD